MVQSTAEVLEERGTRYGVFMGQARIAQSLHLVLRQGMEMAGKNTFDFAPDELEAMHMIVNKIARIYNGDNHYSDSWRDIAGYATLVADRLDNDSKREQLLLESQNDGAGTETETNRTDNESDTARGDSEQEQDSSAERPSRPTGRTELRWVSVDGETPETEPGVPGAHRQPGCGC